MILADPIFQGLAISLMAGEIASLLISRMAVPVPYYMANMSGTVLSFELGLLWPKFMEHAGAIIGMPLFQALTLGALTTSWIRIAGGSVTRDSSRAG